MQLSERLLRLPFSGVCGAVCFRQVAGVLPTCGGRASNRSELCFRQVTAGRHFPVGWGAAGTARFRDEETGKIHGRFQYFKHGATFCFFSVLVLPFAFFVSLAGGLYIGCTSLVFVILLVFRLLYARLMYIKYPCLPFTYLLLLPPEVVAGKAMAACIQKLS